MIEIERAKIAYKNYSNRYDRKDGKISLKIDHMERVAKISKKIARRRGLSEEQVKLAELIGLLHDIGRFEQIKRFHTFNDSKSIRHADLGVEILFQQREIENFVQNRQYDEIIRNAIYYHGRNTIGEGLDEITKLQCQIIRDADKLDILFILNQDDPQNIFDIEKGKDLLDEKMTKEVFDDIMQRHELDYSKKKTNADCMAQWICYVYDINFEETMQEILSKKYISLLIKRFPFKDENTIEKINRLQEDAKRYMEQRLTKKEEEYVEENINYREAFCSNGVC